MVFFKQIKQRGDNFSYIIADEDTKDVAIIDPSFNASAIIKVLKDHAFRAKYIVNTHSHGDHTAGNKELKSIFNAKIVAHHAANIQVDVPANDGQSLQLGKVIIKVIYTPGHSRDSICLLADGKLLTGDTLFVGECGRTDLPSGSPEDMYDSLFNKLMKLDENIEVYPGHDYGPRPRSTIGEEKRTNYTLEKRSLQEFIEFMQT